MSADELKSKGNAAFSAQNYPEAIEWFTKAIEVDGTNHVLYSNRSACYAGLTDYAQALQDADKCVSLKPDWGKGYGRQGAAHHGMGDLEKALEVYQAGLKVEPTLSMLLKGVEEVKSAAMEMDSEGGIGINQIITLLKRPDLVEFCQSNKTLGPLLMQPDFPPIVEALRDDPTTITQHLQDERVQTLLQELLRTKNPDVLRKAEEAELRRRREADARREADRRGKDEAEKKAKADAAAKLAAMTEADFEGNPSGLSNWFKDKGNTLYKNKSFDEAVAMYTKAYEADPTNVAVLTNRAAVKFEQKMYEDCIVDCKKAIEEGRANRADFKIIARAFERMGNALVKEGKLEEALKAYQSSLLENRVSDVEKKARDLERDIKKKAEEAYQNPELASAEKEKGNALVKEGQFVEAKAVYDEAIRRNPKDHTLYSNRALCFMKLLAWPQAKDDCDKALSIEPKFVRALERRGNCLMMLKEHTKALTDFRKGLDIDPTNQGCIIGAQKVEAVMFSGKRDPEAVANAMKDPEIQQILQDPIINNVLRDLQSGNHKAGQDAMKDPVIAERIQKLAAAGILSFG